MNSRVLLPLMKHSRDRYLRTTDAVNQREGSQSDWKFARAGESAAFAEKRILGEPHSGIDEPRFHCVSGWT